MLTRVVLAQEPVDGGAPAAAAVALVEELPAPKPLAKRPMFWLAVGGGLAVIATGITLAFVLNPVRDPNPSWGVVVGN